MVIAIIVEVIILYFIIIYNSLTRKTKNVEQAKGSIDIYLKQRFDLIPNLIECVKGYKEYEENVLVKITELRSLYNEHSDFETAGKINEQYNKFMLLVEQYPEIKAGEQFINLQKALTKIESQLQAARRIYNSEVTMYNTKVKTIPANIVAGITGFKELPLFEVENVEKENINVKI